MDSLDSIASCYFREVAEGKEAPAVGTGWDWHEAKICGWIFIFLVWCLVIVNDFFFGPYMWTLYNVVMLVLMIGIVTGITFWPVVRIVGFLCLPLLKFVEFLGNRARSRRIDRQVQRGVAAYERGDADAIVAVHRYALDVFRKRIREHRNRMLGPHSVWERARAQLADALDKAEGRVAYWNERLREDAANELASLQIKTARQLENKFRSALKEVDARGGVLRQFFHRCEARLAVMDRSNKDIEEVKQLKSLAGSADDIIAHAKGTLEALAGQFVAAAQNIADALGSTDRMSLSVLAGEAPLDNIEYLADKINESSDDHTAIEALLDQTLQE